MLIISFTWVSQLGEIIVSTVNGLLYITTRELDNLKIGEIFVVCYIFEVYEWNRISLSVRLLLGTLFLNYVKAQNIGDVSIEKTSTEGINIYNDLSIKEEFCYEF